MKNYSAHWLFRLSLVGSITILFASLAAAQNMFRKVSDFDGDGKADFAVTRNVGGLKYWWIWQTTAGVRVVQWGIFGDRPVAGDYDGDGKTDLAVWKPADNNENFSKFSILESQTNTLKEKTFFNFIISGPMHQDYNGDGKTDTGTITGETSLTLCVNYSGIDTGFCRQTFGIGIRIGDMDGDHRAENSYLSDSSSPQNWDVIMTNLETNTARRVTFGLQNNDQYQMADFDGDAIGDLTVWRPSDGTWWWIRSSDNTVRVVQWGTSGDFPVPADYDGDGKTDLAIYRSGAQSYYWILGSQNGVNVFPWGTSPDAAVAF